MIAQMPFLSSMHAAPAGQSRSLRQETVHMPPEASSASMHLDVHCESLVHEAPIVCVSKGAFELPPHADSTLRSTTLDHSTVDIVMRQTSLHRPPAFRRSAHEPSNQSGPGARAESKPDFFEEAASPRRKLCIMLPLPHEPTRPRVLQALDSMRILTEFSVSYARGSAIPDDMQRCGRIVADYLGYPEHWLWQWLNGSWRD